MKVRFVFIGEGTSDSGLVPHLENLCIEIGADEAAGIPIDSTRLSSLVGKRAADKIAAAMKLEPEANLFFFHRDADARDPEPRYAELDAAVIESGLTKPWVAVVPVQEIEAWLLLDPQAILNIAGKPGSNPKILPLPAVHEVENTANPKEVLQKTILAVSETTGRRHKQMSRDFPNQRRLLLERLPTTGHVTKLKAWVRMRDDLQNALAAI